MCRTYETKSGPYTRLCYRHGARAGQHVPGRLSDLPTTPSGRHIAGGSRSTTTRGAGRTCASCPRPLGPGCTPPWCVWCMQDRMDAILRPTTRDKRQPKHST